MDGSAQPGRAARARLPQLAVTAQFVFHGQVGGAEHMLYNVLRGLDRDGVGLRVLCADAGNLDPAFVAELDRMQPGSLVPCGGGTGSRFVSEQLACLRPGIRTDAVLFPNYFVPPLVPARLGRVVTVLHDMQFRHYPANFSTRKRAWLKASQAFALHRADTLVAISDFVRDDILRQYGDRHADKVVTIPNPISWARFEPVPGAATGRPIERPYVLSVAAGYAHKNLEVLVRAFAEVARRDPDLQLVFCGQDYAGLRGVSGARPGLAALAQELGLDGRVLVTGYVDDAALGRWYRHAAMFAFPSLFEGFGMPPVEALGFGLPTLTTALTALPEVTLGLAQTVQDPASPAEWADRMLDMVRNPAQSRPSDRAAARLRRRYSPERIGRLYALACLS